MKRFGTMALAGALLLSACSETGGGAGPGAGGASGTLPCSAGQSTYDRLCDLRAVRRDGGRTEIHVSNPASPEGPATRVLVFENGTWSTPGGAQMDVGYYGDIWVLGVQNREFYRVSDAILAGG